MRKNPLGLVLIVLASCGGPATISTLPPPPAGQGFQLAVPPFTVNVGDEIQACYFFAVPGNPGDEVWINRYRVAQAVGSHHMNVFRVKTIVNLSGNPGDSVVGKNGMGECFKSANWADWPLVVNSQQASEVDWNLPDGVGAKFMAGELLMLQTHFVNATTQKTPAQAQVAVNFYTMPGPAANELGTMFQTNQNILVCPGDVGRSFTKTCKFGSTAPVNVIAANGHFHSRGKLFEIMSTDPNGGVIDEFYKSTSWDDPPMSRDFNEVIPAGGGVQWKCTFDFPANSCGGQIDKTTGQPTCCYDFGGIVETKEHCNAFVYYWPKVQDINCF
jgi:hypothetical protein